MNSEELEVSLRSEFENYLKGIRDEMREHAVELQSKFEAEIENHRSNLAEALRLYLEQLDSEQEFDEAFQSSVLEHLRLARDEGSKVAATAMAEAEELERETAVAPADFASIRDALNDISSYDSQAGILKSLINHSSEFAPRGAFFIIKNEHFVGWKVFGADGDESENAIREIRFPVAEDTILGDAVRALSTKEGSYGAHSDDYAFLDPLHYGQPDRMYAIPLLARGRGVAVMYVDYGSSGVNLNVEALETLMRMAGLTVELHAASQTARTENRETAAADFENAQDEYQEAQPAEHVVEEQAFEETPPHEVVETPYAVAETPETAVEEQVPESTTEYAFSDEHPADQTVEFGSDEVSPAEATSDYAFSTTETETAEEPFGGYAEEERSEFETGEAAFGETQEEEEQAAVPVHEYQPEPEVQVFGSHDTAFGSDEQPEASPFDTASPEFEPALAGVSAKPEAAIEVSPSNRGRARLSDRPVDLPIEVAEDERRLHNDARRFARLLVSEIKLYNEKKVQEGRQAADLYERLREAIDRSREMYDKRVQPPVAAKFDYFHYELVNALADGEVDRLGTGYPGSRV